MKNIFLWVSALVVLLAVSGVVAAQDVDPPSRVARIAYITGSVSFQPASVDGWSDASLNYPMTAGDNLYTDNGARSVLRIGQNSIRLNSDTNFQFLNLSDNIVQASINAGSLSLRLRHLFDSESWEVDTPNGAITLLRTGEYRVDTDSSRNATMVTVRTGDIEVTANNQSFPVHSGQTAYFDNSGNPPEVQSAYQPDDFDSFASSRDRLEDAPPPQYVSPDMDGYEDLNANGDWRDTPEYGPVWTPHVAADWTPYHEGRWAWIEPWGWTWVDDEPWGFAPFHYGRWAYINNRWGWCPGAVSARVYYAPALVAFVGGGGFNVAVSVGGGGGLVGWFPLGPREAYYPSYHVSKEYVRQVNVTNTRITNVNVTNINVTNINYVNRNAVVAMPQNSFVTAQPVRRAGVRVDPNQIRQAQVIGAAPKVAPQRESILANSSGRSAVVPPAAIADRPVVAKLAPPPRAVPFSAKQQMLQQHPGTPVAPAELQALRPQSTGQNQSAGRIQVQRVNTQQVHSVTPTVRPGIAPTFSQRPIQTQAAPGQPSNENLRTQPNPVGRPQNLPPTRGQVQPPVGQTPPPVREDRAAPTIRQQQAQPPVSTQAPPTRGQVQPPIGQTPPPVREDRAAPTIRQQQAQPPVSTQAPPAREQVQPPVRQSPPPVREDRAAPTIRQQQTQPPASPKAPPVREQVQPPVRQAPPAVREERPAPPARTQAPPPPAQAQPEHKAPPPEQKTTPPKKDEKKPEEKQ